MKKKEKKKLKKEAKKRENTSTEEKDRSICQMNCKVHTFMIKHRLNKSKEMIKFRKLGASNKIEFL